MIRVALTVLLLSSMAVPSQAAFFWEGLSRFVDKDYCQRHQNADRCEAFARELASNQSKPPAPRPTQPQRPVAQK